MNGFLTFILILLVVWYGTKLFFKYALPWLILHFINKQQDKFHKGFNPSSTKKDGKVNINVEKQEKAKTADPNFGEYVDFEEVEPEKEPEDE